MSRWRQRRGSFPPAKSRAWAWCFAANAAPAAVRTGRLAGSAAPRPRPARRATRPAAPGNHLHHHLHRFAHRHGGGTGRGRRPVRVRRRVRGVPCGRRHLPARRPHVSLFVDTDVASALLPPRATAPPTALARQLAGHTVAITFVTYGELTKWTVVRRWGPRSLDTMRTFLAALVVLPHDQRVATRWGKIQAYAPLRGCPRPANDSWIAACCLVRELPLATVNLKDYRLRRARTPRDRPMRTLRVECLVEPQHTGGHHRHRTRAEGPGRTPEGGGDHVAIRSPAAGAQVRILPGDCRGTTR